MVGACLVKSILFFSFARFERKRNVCPSSFFLCIRILVPGADMIVNPRSSSKSDCQFIFKVIK